MMTVTPATVSASLCALCALAMGVAIRRGTTCAVAAVNQIVDERKCGRLLALAAASIVVFGGLLLAQARGLLFSVPPGYAVTRLTVAGGVLLGLGASLNGACALGTIARIGAGQWSYLATPIGFYAGCRVGAQGLAATLPRVSHDSPALHAPASAALPLFAVIAWLVACSIRARGMNGRLVPTDDGLDEVVRASWSGHVATAVIGLTYVVLFVVDGAGSYTDTLFDIARGHTAGGGSRMILLGALLLGAMSTRIACAMQGSGFRASPVTLVQLCRCFGGGVLMAWASLLIPGGNDSLLLVATPLLQPYAWVAFTAMCVSIGTATVARRMLRERRQRPLRAPA